MKKKIIVFFILICLTIATISFFTLQNRPPKLVEGADFSVYRLRSDNTSEYILRGVYLDVIVPDTSPYEASIVISMGLVPSGGFAINLSNIYVDDHGNLEIVVIEVNPLLDGSIVTQAVTRPALRILFHENPNSILVRNTDGKLFDIIISP